MSHQPADGIGLWPPTLAGPAMCYLSRCLSAQTGQVGGSSPGTGQGRGCVSTPLPPAQSLCPHRPTWAERSPPGGVGKVSCLVKTPLCCTNAALSWEFSLVKKQFFEKQPLKKKRFSLDLCLPPFHCRNSAVANWLFFICLEFFGLALCHAGS